MVKASETPHRAVHGLGLDRNDLTQPHAPPETTTNRGSSLIIPGLPVVKNWYALTGNRPRQQASALMEP
jgi:hypothetical protein